MILIQVGDLDKRFHLIILQKMLIPFDTLTRKYRFQPQGVLHVGASEGQEANAYHNLKVGRVIWIEAIDSIYLKLKHNLIKYPNQEAIHACVSNRAGKTKFNVANNGGQSSSLLEFGTHSQVHPEVKFDYQIDVETIRIDKIDHDFSGLDFLNIDLQGAELLALIGMGNLLDQFQYAYLEINERELYKGCPLFPQLNQWMKDKGFRFMEKTMCGGFGWGDAFWMR